MPSYFQELQDCMDSTSETLKQAHVRTKKYAKIILFICFSTFQDRAWYGFVQYHDSNGKPGEDEWLPRPPKFGWSEFNITQQDFHNISIYEPCNYASNAAYYKTAIMVGIIKIRFTVLLLNADC